MAVLFDLAAAPDLEPRFNVAPTQDVPAVRLDGGARRLARLRWGLVPMSQP
jgi:putative SOS response-associated peptidase YedK